MSTLTSLEYRKSSPFSRKSNTSSKKHIHRKSSRTSRDRFIRILRQVERVYVPYTGKTKEEAFRRMKQDPVYKQILEENGGIAGVRRILGKHMSLAHSKYGGTFGTTVGGGIKSFSSTLIWSGVGAPLGLTLYPIGFLIELFF